MTVIDDVPLPYPEICPVCVEVVCDWDCPSPRGSRPREAPRCRDCGETLDPAAVYQAFRGGRLIRPLCRRDFLARTIPGRPLSYRTTPTRKAPTHE